jgi:hypothetical protein
MTSSHGILFLVCTALGACGHPSLRLPPDRTGRAVYATVLDAAFFQPWGQDTLRFGRGRIPRHLTLLSVTAPLIVDTTRADSSAAWLRREIPGLPQSLVAAYTTANLPSAPITETLISRLPIKMLTLNEFRAGSAGPKSLSDRFLETVSPTRPYVSLSRVIFSPDSTGALLELAGYYGSLDAEGTLVWLVLEPGGWRIMGHTMRWVS